jgi:hypothetical protein
MKDGTILGMKKKYATVAEAPFGKGNLIVRQEAFSGTNAYEDGKISDLPPERTLEYRDETGKIPLKRLGDIKKLADRMKLNLVNQIAQQPADYAVLFSAYLCLGVVIEPTFRFEYMRSEYGINLEANIPRVENETLRCLIFAPNLSTVSPPLWDIEWQLANLTYCYKKKIRRHGKMIDGRFMDIPCIKNEPMNP